MKKSKVLALVLALVMTASVFAGCGAKNSSNGTTQGSEEKVTTAATQQGTTASAKETKAASGTKSLKVWTYMSVDFEVPVLKQVAEGFTKETGIKVEFVSGLGNDKFQVYVQAAKSKNGPDMMFGIPHDNLGTFFRGGLLQEIPEGFLDKSAYLDTAIKAVTYDGKMYAVPLSIETEALFYNTDKVAAPPATYEEFIEKAKEVGFMQRLDSIYDTYPWVAANGGYIFKDNNGSLDPNDIGLGNEGAIRGYDLVKSFVTGYKFMKPDVTADIAKANFQNGKIGMFISGPWQVAAFQKAKTKFAVAPLPKYNDQPMRTMVGIYSAFVNPNSANQKEAYDLMKYLMDNSAIPLLKAANRIPVIKAELEKPEVKEDKIVSAFAEQASYGDPMPNIPEMNSVWSPTGNSLKLVITGKLTPEKAAEEIVKQTKDGISKMNK